LEAGSVEHAPFASTKDMDNQLVIANSAAINVAFQEKLQLADEGGSGANSSKAKNAHVPTAGIIFAIFLFGAGVLVGRKKKSKMSSGVVGAFARNN
jgi:hypothetical protein